MSFLKTFPPLRTERAYRTTVCCTPRRAQIGTSGASRVGSGCEVVEESEERDALGIWCRSICGDEEFFPSRPQIPGHGPGAYSDIPPAVRDPEFTDVEVSRHTTTLVEHDVGEAVVAVADDEVFLGGREAFESLDRRVETEVLMFGM
jgi:hypothetical protein